MTLSVIMLRITRYAPPHIGEMDQGAMHCRGPAGSSSLTAAKVLHRHNTALAGNIWQKLAMRAASFDCVAILQCT